MKLHHNYMACIFTMDDEKEEGYIFIWYNYIEYCMDYIQYNFCRTIVRITILSYLY
jgi:hypothetical protein